MSHRLSEFCVNGKGRFGCVFSLFFRYASIGILQVTHGDLFLYIFEAVHGGWRQSKCQLIE